MNSTCRKIDLHSRASLTHTHGASPGFLILAIRSCVSGLQAQHVRVPSDDSVCWPPFLTALPGISVLSDPVPHSSGLDPSWLHAFSLSFPPGRKSPQIESHLHDRFRTSIFLSWGPFLYPGPFLVLYLGHSDRVLQLDGKVGTVTYLDCSLITLDTLAPCFEHRTYFGNR